MTRKRVALLAVVAAGVIAFFALDLGSLLSFEALRARQDELEAAYRDAPALFLVVYFGLYVIVAALSLPGASALTLVAGALFGFLPALVVVSFASSIGATLAFLLSRTLFRDAVQARFGDRLEVIQRGVERDGAFYLFTLRLVPVFPFFVVNLVMGLTRIRTWTFYWVSQVGMLAGTAVYVNAGTQLGTLESPAGILSPRLLGSFALLGVFPLVARWIVRRVRGEQPPTAAGPG